MKPWQKICAGTAIVLAVAGVRIYFLWRERNEPATERKPQYVQRRLTNDDVVSVRKMYIDSEKSARDLIGKQVWMKAGFQMPYFRYSAHHVQLEKTLGILPSVEKLSVTGIDSQAVPATLEDRVPHGTKQFFAVFLLNGSTDTYALPIGDAQGSDQTFLCDQIFYYDDPHQMYKHWPAEIWSAVEKHEPVPGMNELQATMALGQIQRSDSASLGNRTVHYQAADKKWSIVFVNNKATNIKAE